MGEPAWMAEISRMRNTIPRNPPHWKAIGNSFALWEDGMLTTRELMWRVIDEYTMAYMKGHEPPNYPMPVVYLSNTTIASQWFETYEHGRSHGISPAELAYDFRTVW